MTAGLRGPVTDGGRGSAFSLPDVDIGARGSVAEVKLTLPSARRDRGYRCRPDISESPKERSLGFR